MTEYCFLNFNYIYLLYMLYTKSLGMEKLIGKNCINLHTYLSLLRYAPSRGFVLLTLDETFQKVLL